MDLTLDQIRPSQQTSKEMSKRYVWMDTAAIVENLLSLKSKGEQVFELRSIQGKNPAKHNLMVAEFTLPESNCASHMK